MICKKIQSVGICVTLVSVFLFGVWGFAQETPTTPEETTAPNGDISWLFGGDTGTITFSDFDLSEYPAISLYLSITDSAGRPVDILNIENLTVLEEETPVTTTF